jgi:hypothetical protein
MYWSALDPQPTLDEFGQVTQFYSTNKVKHLGRTNFSFKITQRPSVRSHDNPETIHIPNIVHMHYFLE